MVIFAHVTGSNRHSQSNDRVAREFNHRHLATLLFDLLTHHEAGSGEGETPRFDLSLLADRLKCATAWAATVPGIKDLPKGFFGAGTGAAAALSAAVSLPEIKAIVCRGGRTDLAGECLRKVKAPTLLVVGAEDFAGVGWNYSAYEHLCCLKCRMLIGGANHLFNEPGSLEQAADLAGDWFHKHLKGLARYEGSKDRKQSAGR